jgi:C4-type Zn-finger protein
MHATDIHSETNWEHVHRCPSCERIIKAAEIPHSAVATGVITCPKCDYSGPINVQIVPEDSAPS